MIRKQVYSVLLAMYLPMTTASATEVQAPSLIGVDKDVAIGTLENLGLKAEITLEQNCGPFLSVVKQQPPPGSQVMSGGVVILWVNPDKGVSVPNVIGSLFEDGAAALGSLGLKSSFVTRKIDQNSGGFCAIGFKDLGLNPAIVDTAPKAGTFVCPQTTVTLFRDHKFSAKYKNLKPGEICP